MYEKRGMGVEASGEGVRGIEEGEEKEKRKRKTWRVRRPEEEENELEGRSRRWQKIYF